MEKIFTLATKRILPLLVFICLQAKAWAVDTTNTVSVNRSHNIFTQPWIWIAIIVVSIIVLLGPIKNTNNYRVTMKKNTINKERNAA